MSCFDDQELEQLARELGSGNRQGRSHALACPVPARAVRGKPEPRRHCAHLLPLDELPITLDDVDRGLQPDWDSKEVSGDWDAC